MANRNNLKNRIYSQILRSRRNVFLRRDFRNISTDYDQVGRALRQLMKAELLIKIGYGLYAQARINRFTGKPMLAAKGGFNQVTKEALNRLNVNWQDPINELNRQVPSRIQLTIKGRFNRKIQFNQFQLRVKHA